MIDCCYWISSLFSLSFKSTFLEKSLITLSYILLPKASNYPLMFSNSLIVSDLKTSRLSKCSCLFFFPLVSILVKRSSCFFWEASISHLSISLTSSRVRKVVDKRSGCSSWSFWTGPDFLIFASLASKFLT